MSRRRATVLLRGLASLVATVVLLAGVPAGLVTLVGWPLPTSLPDGDTLSRALNTGVSDEFVVNTLAVIAWLAWAQLALALIVEAVAVVHGRQPRDLPLVRGLQPIAARLVAGIVLLASPIQPARAAADSPRVPVAMRMTSIEQVVDLDGFDASSGQAPVPAAAESPVSAGVRTVTVQRHDTYWALAERELDDGLRWREIRDLNVGRTMPGGHTIVSGDDTLRAGWSLQLPVESRGTHSLPSPEEVIVEPGDNLWDLSEDQLAVDLARDPADAEVVPYWLDVIDANRDRLVESGDPSLIHPGQTMVLPPTGHGSGPPPEGQPPSAPSSASPTVPAPPPQPDPSPTTTVPPGPTEAPTATAAPTVGGSVDPEDDGSNTSVPWTVAVGGISSIALAVGAKRAIDRRRRRFSLDHPGRASLPTRDADRKVHRRIVASADEQTIGDLRSAMTHLSRQLADSEVTSRPRVVQHGDHRLEVLMDTPATDAPEGWRAEGDGFLWVWEASEPPGPPTGDCAAPLLATMGQPDDGAQLYLDLEAEALIELVGDPECARGLARSIATEVALSPLAHTVRVLVVGDLLGVGSSTLEHLSVVDSWQEVEADIGAWAEQSHAVLDEAGWTSTFAARAVDPDHEALAPLLVVSAKHPPPGLVAHLQAHRPAATALVVADAFDHAACTIECQPEVLAITDIDLTCVPQELDDDTLASMIRILDTAELDDEPAAPDLEGVAGAEPVLDIRDTDDVEDRPQLFQVPYGSNGHKNAQATSEQTQFTEPDYEVVVRLLGEIRVDGPRPLRPKPTAVVAYIALHRSVSIEALEDACWADPSPGLRKRLKDVMSECRSGIGSHNLPVSTDGHYTVGPSVVTDLELFDRRVERAADEPPAEQADAYRSALDLVTGKILTYPSRAGSSFGWIDTENLRSQWELRIQSVAQHCIETYLSIDAPDDAIDVANHILQALPLNTAITEALMRAHAAAGNTQAVETVYRAHAEGLDRILNVDPEESTAALFRDLAPTRVR